MVQQSKEEAGGTTDMTTFLEQMLKEVSPKLKELNRIVRLQIPTLLPGNLAQADSADHWYPLGRKISEMPQRPNAIPHSVTERINDSQCLQLEAAQGGKDEEAAAALAQLKQNMAALAHAEAAVSTAGRTTGADDGPDEVQLASVLDRSGCANPNPLCHRPSLLKQMHAIILSHHRFE